MEWVLLRKTRGYTTLPTEQRHPLKRRRCFRRLLASLAFAFLVVLLAVVCQGIPPSYDDVRAFERRLPQHSHPSPVRYLRFPGHLWGHGLNNVLQEALLMSYLAYVANVSFVFEDYTWSHLPLPWTLYDFALRPTRIPINAFISGPTAGGPMSAPLAVSAEFYNHICTDVEPYILSSPDAPNDADGLALIDYWKSQLADADAQCIEIDSSTILFDRFLFGGPRILSLLDTLTSSPILSQFTWSPLVQSALTRNFALLHLSSSDPVGTLPGLVALHLRRGDYARHCPNLANWNALYMGINQYPALPDRFDPRPFDVDSDARMAYYLAHCLPTTTQLVERLREIRREMPWLKRVYVLSNEAAWRLRDVKDALAQDGWSDVVSSVDVQLDAEQYHVSMAVDMAIAERADVFLGNGFSSLTSNVVLLRLAKGMDPSTNRFL